LRFDLGRFIVLPALRLEKERRENDGNKERREEGNRRNLKNDG
jgi:hypothetical protein